MQYMDRRTLLCAMALGVLFAIRRAPAVGVPVFDGKSRWVGCRRRPVCSPGCPGTAISWRSPLMTAPASRVVGAFAQFCADTGTRLTFFVNGANSSWSVNAPALRPMVSR